MDGVGGSAVAVAGTLLGVLITGLLQHWTSGRAERTARLDRLRDAAAGLADALTDYRERLYWQERVDAHPGRTAAEHDDVLRAGWAARSGVNRALNRLRLTTRDARVLDLAERARAATFGIPEGTHTSQEARARQYAFLDGVVAVTSA